jgi:hypothetical protein
MNALDLGAVKDPKFLLCPRKSVYRCFMMIVNSHIVESFCWLRVKLSEHAVLRCIIARAV